MKTSTQPLVNFLMASVFFLVSTQVANGQLSSLSEQDRQDIADQSVATVNFLASHIEDIGTMIPPKLLDPNRSADLEKFKKKETIRKATVVHDILKKFVDSNENTVGINNRGKIERRTATQYFYRLAALSKMYDEVSIETWVNYIGEIVQKGKDVYETSATFCQEFSARRKGVYEKNGLAFHDVTCKNIIMTIRRGDVQEISPSGETIRKSMWVVQIGDITVEEK